MLSSKFYSKPQNVKIVCNNCSTEHKIDKLDYCTRCGMIKTKMDSNSTTKSPPKRHYDLFTNFRI